MPRLILIPLILVALLVLAAIILVPLFLDEEKVLEIASTQLREQTGATLTVGGDTSLSLFPVLGVSLQEAAIAMPGEEQASISARALSIGVQMMPLLSRPWPGASLALGCSTSSSSVVSRVSTSRRRSRLPSVA